MTPEILNKVAQAYKHYLGLPDDQRIAFLDQLRSEAPEVATVLERRLSEPPAAVTIDQQKPPQGSEVSTNDYQNDSNDAETIDWLANDRLSSEQVPSSMAGRYVIQEEIARGGMGAVLRARDPDIERILAIKVMLPKSAHNARAQKRFLDEAKITGQLQHPGIPPVHEIGQLEGGFPFFAMKLIEGETFSRYLRDRTTPGQDLPRFLGIFGQICQTVANAHSQGILHRDLKPSNVMVGAFGEVQVMDWGLAKKLTQMPGEDETVTIEQDKFDAALDQPGMSQTGDVMGTPAYIAPEQARGEIRTLDPRAD
ncbi:MAG: serine/threonine-protein kinase, partial [Gemmataceae bacterium]